MACGQLNPSYLSVTGIQVALIAVDTFVTQDFQRAILHGPLDDRWRSAPLRTEKLRFLVYLAREARRVVHRFEGEDVEGFAIATRGAKAIRGWDPDAPRNDADLRPLLHDIADALYPGAFWINRYVPPWREREPGVPPPARVSPRQTEVSSLDLPQAFWDAAREERERGATDPLVDLDTGAPFNPKTHGRALRELAIDRARRRRRSDTPQETVELIGYLHDRSVRSFSDRFTRAHDGLVARAQETKKDTVRHAELHAIRALRVQPVPVYTTSGRTQRLVPHGQGLATVPTWVRRAVLSDCWELDMASAQLALVGALWDVRSVRDLLASGVSYWTEVGGWLHERFPNGTFQPDRHVDHLKGLLKTVTYGLCFGMEERNIRRWRSPYKLRPTEKEKRKKDLAFLRRAFGAPSRDVGCRLLGHPLVRDLLVARERRLSEIEAAGGLADVFGREYRVGDRVGGKRVTVRSALAAEAQAAEHFVMLRAARPFLEEAGRVGRSASPSARVEAEILLWQSDGFTIRVRQRGREGRWIGEADAGLQAGCRELERRLGCPTIHTGLEVKAGPADA